MKKRIVVVLLLACAVLGGLAALASGGSSGDPLISLSYLTDTFLPQLLGKAEAQADAGTKPDYDAAQGRLDAEAARLEAGAGLYDGWSQSDAFVPLTCRRGDVLRLSPGSGLLFLAGSASSAADGGEVIDVTAGSAAAGFGALSPNHRYLSGENAVTAVTVLSDAVSMAPQGYYDLVPGAWGETVTPFTDLLSTAWYYDDVHYVYGAGLFNGVSETAFAPTASMTRAMLATTLFRHAGAPAGAWDQDAVFIDVPGDAWFHNAVGWAAACGIVNGMGDQLYAPNNNVTREQMVTMLCRYAAHTGRSTAASGTLDAFPDQSKVSEWAVSAMAWAVDSGIVGGRDDGSLDPGGTASRAEVSAMLRRFSALSS